MSLTARKLRQGFFFLRLNTPTSKTPRNKHEGFFTT
jgi:hypothetical protein